MKIFTVINRTTGFCEQFHSLKDAKLAMKKNDAKGFITKVYSNGDWVPMGEIQLFGKNKTFVANSRQTNKSY